MKGRGMGRGLGLFFTGLTVGTTASLLLAPHNGRKMRKKMGAQLAHGRDAAFKAGRSLLKDCGSACATSGRAVGRAGGWTWKRVRRAA